VKAEIFPAQVLEDYIVVKSQRDVAKKYNKGVTTNAR